MVATSVGYYDSNFSLHSRSTRDKALWLRIEDAAEIVSLRWFKALDPCMFKLKDASFWCALLEFWWAPGILVKLEAQLIV
jgi:hypothetical protein